MPAQFRVIDPGNPVDQDLNRISAAFAGKECLGPLPQILYRLRRYHQKVAKERSAVRIQSRLKGGLPERTQWQVLAFNKEVDDIAAIDQLRDVARINVLLSYRLLIALAKRVDTVIVSRGGTHQKIA